MLVHGSPWPMHGAGGTLAWGAGAGNATAETFVAPSAMMANAMMMERMGGPNCSLSSSASKFKSTVDSKLIAEQSSDVDAAKAEILL